MMNTNCEKCGSFGACSTAHPNYFRDDDVVFVCDSCATKIEIAKGAVELALWEDFGRAMKPAVTTIRDLSLDEIADTSGCPSLVYVGSPKELTAAENELSKLSSVLSTECTSDSKKSQLLLQGFMKFGRGFRPKGLDVLQGQD